MLRFHLVSLFPEFFRSPLETALLGRAREAGIVDFSFHDPRSFSTSRHHHVDDRPYGGGPGMVMQGEPVAAALRSIEKPGRMILLAPSGRPLNDALARELALEEDLTLICGRYEGLDARLLDIFPLEPVSVGEAVLNGGETAALAVIESVARLVPGFMGKEESGDDESFSNGLLEYPPYTRPEVREGREVPEVLRGGDHGAVARWRRQQSLATTLRVRPDLLDSAPLVAEDARHLATLPRTRAGRNLSFCLVHYPVLLGRKNSGVSSLTNLDIHDIARISRSYAMGPFYAVTPLEDQQRLLQAIVRHWTQGAGSRGNPDRARRSPRFVLPNPWMPLWNISRSARACGPEWWQVPPPGPLTSTRPRRFVRRMCAACAKKVLCCCCWVRPRGWPLRCSPGVTGCSDPYGIWATTTFRCGARPLSWPTEFWAITSKRHSFSSRRQPSQGCVFKE